MLSFISNTFLKMLFKQSFSFPRQGADNQGIIAPIAELSTLGSQMLFF